MDSLTLDFQNKIQLFEKQRNNLSKKQLRERQESLGQLQYRLNQLKQTNQSKLEKLSTQSTQTVINDINDFVKSYGEKHGYQFIYGANGNGQLMYAQKTYDLSDEIIKGLNDEFKN